jgi:hypothetical protein
MNIKAWWTIPAILSAALVVRGCDCSGQNRIELTAQPAEIYASGVAFSTIEAKAFYNGGIVEESTTVTFRTTDGSLDELWSEDDPQKSTTAYTVAGIAAVKLYSSRTPGVATVTASYVNMNSETISATIDVKFTNASKVTDRGLTFKCESRNLGALDTMLSTTPSTPCTVTATTISGETVKSPDVRFMTEAGVVEWSTDVSPSAYVYTANSQGTLPAPKDVPPIDAIGEPCIQVGGVTYNPRDGLATVIVYMRGMEWFDDVNHNGIWEPGEDFDDLGAPYVDVNDNGQFDQGEPFPDVYKDGTYHQKNGKWDGDTWIWKAFKVLWSGKPKSAMGVAHALLPQTPAAATSCSGTYSAILPSFIDIPNRGSGTFKVRVVDLNLNPLAANDSSDTITIDVTGGDGKGTGDLPFTNYTSAGMYIKEADDHTGDGVVTGGFDVSRIWDVTISDPLDHYGDPDPLTAGLEAVIDYTPDRVDGEQFETSPMSITGTIKGAVSEPDGGTTSDGGN